MDVLKKQKDNGNREQQKAGKQKAFQSRGERGYGLRSMHVWCIFVFAHVQRN